MSEQLHHITHAFWLAPSVGCVLLDRDWKNERPPPLVAASNGLTLTRMRPAPSDFIGRFTGYYRRDADTLVFCQEDHRHPHLDFRRTPVRVVGPFNGWGRDGDQRSWELQPRECSDGTILWERAVPVKQLKGGPCHFRFVSSHWHWLRPLASAINLATDEAGNVNYLCQPSCSGQHVFLFDVKDGRGMDGDHSLTWRRGEHQDPVPVRPGLSFYDLKTDLPLGAHVEGNKTVFRVFAPRARKVEVEVVANPADSDGERHAMTLTDDLLTWEARLSGNLHGTLYFLVVEGENDGVSTQYEADRRLLDPWALAAAGPSGPGIVVDRSTLPTRSGQPAFDPPHHQDLVVLEGHLRDLTAHAPIALPDEERLGFTGLRKWLEADDSYVTRLGINALELQPVSQFDSATREEYHWGYMPTNFFAPCSHYAADPAAASQIRELSELVAACHQRGLAVILDVVYNHVGEPPFLLFLDKSYYFHVEADGELTNWSGCGNTLRAESAMSRRLIIESLTYLVETFDVDGFRFDLGELLTIEVLKEIETALKKIKPSIILIAEPWSFRGNIAWELRTTGFSFWNDEFREFLPKYLHGHGDAGGLAYFMKGCLDHLSAWPAQSINYTESHDDRCWLDKITENPEHDGTHPNANDIFRTHLMAAILFTSIGVPMLSAGQDFLRSKGGRNNTYLEGEVNALDYGALDRYGRTHNYFRQWISFRLSPWGELLRLWDSPGPDYIRAFGIDDHPAAALLFNADRSRGSKQILFAINPHMDGTSIALPDIPQDDWLELADRENFNPHGIFNGRLKENQARVDLGPLDCGLWVREASK